MKDSATGLGLAKSDSASKSRAGLALVARYEQMGATGTLFATSGLLASILAEFV